jgi:hypothetical protein
MVTGRRQVEHCDLALQPPVGQLRRLFVALSPTVYPPPCPDKYIETSIAGQIEPAITGTFDSKRTITTDTDYALTASH